MMDMALHGRVFCIGKPHEKGLRRHRAAAQRRQKRERWLGAVEQPHGGGARQIGEPGGPHPPQAMPGKHALKSADLTPLPTCLQLLTMDLPSVLDDPPKLTV